MISACIITKNEIENLKKCITALRKYPCEIVVIDTGSTDGSLELAKEQADVSDSFEWCDDFSKARNYAASKAYNDIILVVDTDEIVETLDAAAIKDKFDKDINTIGLVKLTSPYRVGTEELKSVDKLARIYDRRKFVFKRAIHEQIMPISSSDNFSYWESGASIYHTGYILPEKEMKEKLSRNLRMLEKLEVDSGDDYTTYQIGISYLGMGESEKAIEQFEKTFLHDIPAHASWVRNMMVNYGYLLVNLNRAEEALDLEGLWEEFADVADYSLMMGCVYIRNHMLNEGIMAFERAKTQSICEVEGANSYLADYNIGVLYECMGQKEQAIDCYLQCGSYEKALEGLARIKKL